MGPQAGSTSNATSTVKNETSYKNPPSSGSDMSQPECENARGRRQDRESSSTAKAEDESDDNKDEVEGLIGKPRKRKRSRKGLEKNFPCAFQGCGKSYSRAEHLYRHRLNHTPKKIYECNFPGCERQFVRQDLCTRHRERHTARGSHLQRKDPYFQANDGRPTLPSPTTGHREHFNNSFRPLSATSGTSASIPRSSTTPLASPLDPSSMPGHSPLPSVLNGFQSHRNSHTALVGEQLRSPHAHIASKDIDYGHSGHLQRSNGDDQYYAHAVSRPYGSKTPIDQINTPRYDPNIRSGNFGSTATMSPRQLSSHTRSTTATGSGDWRSSPIPYSSSMSTHQSSLPQHSSEGHGPSVYARHQNFPPMLPLPPPVYSTAPPSSVPLDRPIYPIQHVPQASLEGQPSSEMANPHTFDQVSIDPQSTSYPTQTFDGDADRSPFTLPEDFTTWLFNDPQLNFLTIEGHRPASMSFGATAFMDDSANASHMTQGSYEDIMNGFSDSLVPQHPMSVTSIVGPPQTEAVLSETKWQQLLELIEVRFNETDHAPVDKQKKVLLYGNREDQHHVLSLPMMQTYIRSYWYHFHPQMPILHKPTFAADKAQNLLLVAVIAIGASCLDKEHGHQVTQAAAELSSFLAWHLRGEIFKDKDFTPPAKLWVFQTLLLLEVYEKMYSTRLLHERAVIHHAATLTLMRRGRYLLDRTGDSPPGGSIEKAETLTNDTRNSPYSHSSDPWWNHWIKDEAIRRVAFAAFIVDSIHANVFGHTATMVAHEMKMQLPCDESLWSATSRAEVARIENSLKESGIKPVSFFHGLKNTLNSKFVRTNSFGRTALMAGLLSVSWHMNQRDLQVRSLGALKALGGKDIWRGTLTKAFDFWKFDFDQSVNRTISSAVPNWYQPPAKLDGENIFENRTVLHHLAHMATHADIVSCQIFAKAKRLLGRKTLLSDYKNAQSKIRDHWAPKPSARDATFYALKFLVQVLTPDTAILKRSPNEAGMGGSTTYSARDDSLINRPWVVYMAALIVWSYGYALNGPITCPPNLATPDQQTYDMRLFLERVGGVDEPDDLLNTPNLNACAGMLYILRAMFEKCRWELLREGAELLTNCIDMLLSSDT